MRTAIVTGGGSGIGRAIGDALRRDGCRVVRVGRRPEPLAEAGDVGLAADVRDPAWLTRLDEAAPAPEVVVHAAAAYAPYGRLEHLADTDWDDVLAVGVTAAMRLCRHVLPGMRARGHGRIVLVGSLAASHGAHGQAAYATAKAGLVGLARTVAQEAGRDGVTCNVVEVGLVETERVRGAVRPDVVERLVRTSAVGRAGTPEEVADVVAFLCSEQASYVTGAVVPVTGGLGLLRNRE